MSMTPQGIAWIVTYDCNLKCPHCFFSATRREAVLSPVLLQQAMASLRGELPWMHFTGGEPLLKPAALFGLLEALQPFHTGDLGIATNGHWGEDSEGAARIVARLKELGVSGICISVDAFHQPAVAVEATENAARAVAEAGLSRHSYLVASIVPDDQPRAAETNERTLALANRVSASSGLPVGPAEVRSIGRATQWIAGEEGSIPEGPCRDLACCLGETGPFDPQMVWIDPFGNVMICYGIVIGTLDSQPLQVILDEYDPDADPILSHLAVDGPKGLHRVAVEQGVAPEGPFHDECDLCFKSRTSLRDLYPETLTPDECYRVS